MQREDEEVT